MNIEDKIQEFAQHPMTHQLLFSLLKEYKRPNDKINDWIKQGKLKSLKRGLYIWTTKNPPELFSIANVLFAPSYVSAESALAFRGLIPENVYSVISMTFKTSRNFKNSLAEFEYKKIPLPYYTYGIKREALRGQQFAIIATAEKALLDKALITSGVLLRSVIAAQKWLLENLRIEEDQLKNMDTESMKTWMKDAPKKETVTHIIKAIEKL